MNTDDRSLSVNIEKSLLMDIANSCFCASNATLKGNLSMDDFSSVWYGATIRADAEPVHIGKRTNVQEGAIIHVSPGFPCCVGDDVSIGHGAIVHGCSVGNNTIIGMGAIVMNGARVGNNCVVGAGALVTQGSVVEDNTIVVGSPAKPLKAADEARIEANRMNAEHYVRLACAAREEDHS